MSILLCEFWIAIVIREIRLKEEIYTILAVYYIFSQIFMAK